MERYKGLIIGCGNIGAFYDFDKPDVETHAKAFSLFTGFDVSVYDLDPEKLHKVSQRYNFKKQYSIEIEDISKYDVISICSPTTFHYDHLVNCLRAKTRLVLCEKPIESNSDKLNKLIDLYKKSKTTILVNYKRRFIQEYINLKERIKDILPFERITSVIVSYHRGFHNNCSHAFDTLEFLVGQTLDLADIKIGNLAYDVFKDDPTLSFQATIFDNAKLSVIGLSGFKTSFFEIYIHFEKSYVKIIESGNTIELHNYNESTEAIVYKNCLTNYMIPFFEKGVKVLNGKDVTDNFLVSADLNLRMSNLLENIK